MMQQDGTINEIKKRISLFREKKWRKKKKVKNAQSRKAIQSGLRE